MARRRWASSGVFWRFWGVAGLAQKLGEEAFDDGACLGVGAEGFEDFRE